MGEGGESDVPSTGKSSNSSSSSRAAAGLGGSLVGRGVLVDIFGGPGVLVMGEELLVDRV